MPTYTDPTGTFAASADPDNFVFTRAPSEITAIDALAGIDTVNVDFGPAVTDPISFQAIDTYNSGELDAFIQTGPYNPTIWIMNAEVVNYRGGVGDDDFQLKIGPQTSGLSVTFDGNAGNDTLNFDFSLRTDDFTFLVNGADDHQFVRHFFEFRTVCDPRWRRQRHHPDRRRPRRHLPGPASHRPRRRRQRFHLFAIDRRYDRRRRRHRLLRRRLHGRHHAAFDLHRRHHDNLQRPHRYQCRKHHYRRRRRRRRVHGDQAPGERHAVWRRRP